MAHHLTGTKVAFLVARKGTDHQELVEPMRAVREAGGEAVILGAELGTVETKRDETKGPGEVQVTQTFAAASSSDYDAVVIPGGTVGSDRLRMDKDAVKLVKAFMDEGKPVASICHGPWLLVEADALKGRKLTSFASLQTDIRNAGGTWVVEEVVVDRGLITSRNPNDLPAFNRALLDEVAKKARIA